MTRDSEFIDYYNQYKHKVYSFVLYRVGGETQLAEDLTSDIFLKAFERFETYNDSYAFSTWVFTIARNTIIDHYRKTQGVHIDLEDIQEVTPDDRETIEDWHIELDKAPKLEAIYKALDKCSDFQKDCIIMKYLEDKTTKEIAEITDETEGYVRLALSRGLKKIRPMLQTLSLILLIILIDSYQPFEISGQIQFQNSKIRPESYGRLDSGQARNLKPAFNLFRS